MANGKDKRTVHLQCRNRSSSGRSQPDKENTIPLEVCLPVVATRMIKSYLAAALRVGSSLTRSLAKGTGNTGQRQIFRDCCPTGNDRDDVIYMEGRFLTHLG